MRQIKYQETKDILMHKIKPSPLVSEFSEWFYHKYFAKLLNIDLEVIQPSNLELRYSLLIIIENQAGSFKKTDISINHQVEIKEKFAELSVKHNFENINNPNDIVLISLCFFYEKVKSALIQETLDQATIFLKSKYPEILWLERWQDNIAVIYHTDDQSDENEKKVPTKQ